MTALLVLRLGDAVFSSNKPRSDPFTFLLLFLQKRCGKNSFERMSKIPKTARARSKRDSYRKPFLVFFKTPEIFGPLNLPNLGKYFFGIFCHLNYQRRRQYLLESQLVWYVQPCGAFCFAMSLLILSLISFSATVNKFQFIFFSSNVSMNSFTVNFMQARTGLLS